MTRGTIAPLPSRRRALATLLGAGATTLIPRPSTAATAPRARIVFLLLPNGLDDERGWASWMQTGSGATEFLPVESAAALARWRDQLIVLDGIDLADDGPAADTHVSGQLMLLTATSRGRIAAGGRPSVSLDQHLAVKIGQRVTPDWPSLELAVQPDDRGMGVMSYLPDGSPVPPVADPAVAYASLFGPVSGAGGGAGLLDLVTSDIAAMRSRVGARDRRRLDAQMEAVRTIQRRLSAAAMLDGCAAQHAPASVALDDPASFRSISRSHLDLLVAALACDRTRVASVLYRGGLGGLPCLYDPINRPETLHELSHDRKPDFARAKATLFEEVAYLAQRLADIPEGAGTMLDHTILFCGTEIATGHTHQRMPLALIGGGALGLRTGRYLRVPPKTPHARLLAALAQVMMQAHGQTPDPTFGETGTDRTALPDVFA